MKCKICEYIFKTPRGLVDDDETGSAYDNESNEEKPLHWNDSK